MKKIVLTILALVLAISATISTGVTVGATVTEGLTPGFWKNHVSAWVTYDDDDFYDNVFDRGPHITLLDALKAHGNKVRSPIENAFLRHSTAALLNSTYLTGFYDTADVIQDVQWFWDLPDYEAGKNYFEAFNELGD